MRTAQLRINGETKEGILIAGGPGFKVYSISGFEGWVVKIGRQVRLVEDGTPEFKVVSQYVNLRYQSTTKQEQIKNEFNDFLGGQYPSRPSPDREPTL